MAKDPLAAVATAAIVNGMLRVLLDFDIALFRFINSTLANPVADAILPALNHAAPFVPFLVVAGLWIAWQSSVRSWLMGLALAAALILGDELIFDGLKDVVNRGRPASTLENVRVLASGARGGASFPSSHAANAFLAAAVLCYFLPRWKRPILGCAAVVGFSRIYVGVHYPSDVVAGGILGWLCGWGFLVLLRHGWHALGCRSGAPTDAVGARLSVHPIFKTPWPGVCILVALQIARFVWAATTHLDAPPECVRLWCLATDPGGDVPGPATRLAGAWFRIFGSSPLSLWGLPWALQSAWIVLLGWLVWRRSGWKSLASFTLLATFIPLVSQQSFLGSPDQALSDSDWGSSMPGQTLVYYSILALPLWSAALIQLRSHFVASCCTIAGAVWAVSFPALPWWLPALLASGTVLCLAGAMGARLPRIAEPVARWFRVGLVSLVAYGGVVGVAVYEPRFLRKLNLSLLPRDNPHYVQTGWREWVGRIRPKLETSGVREVWTDHATSRDQVQYWLGRSWRVRCPEDFHGRVEPPVHGVFYVREVYLDLAQVHLRDKFIERDDWVPATLIPSSRIRDSTEIFRKRDPIRQFILYSIGATG